MPTYDYICEKCGKQFEVFQSMKDDRIERCLDEGCGGRMRRKIGTGAGLIFKGSGFYITDYRSDSYKAAASKEGGASTGSSSAGGSEGGSPSPGGDGKGSSSGSGGASGGGGAPAGPAKTPQAP